jgi:hypothetical protein
MHGLKADRSASPLPVLGPTIWYLPPHRPVANGGGPDIDGLRQRVSALPVEVCIEVRRRGSAPSLAWSSTTNEFIIATPIPPPEMKWLLRNDFFVWSSSVSTGVNAGRFFRFEPFMRSLPWPPLHVPPCTQLATAKRVRFPRRCILPDWRRGFSRGVGTS